MKVAIVHDFLNQYGGAEKVVEEIARIYPDAPIFTLVFDERRIPDGFPKERVAASRMIGRIPFHRPLYRKILPLYPTAVESFDLKDYDLVVSSSYLFAKGVITREDAVHVSYCHTPMRQGWSHAAEYMRRENESRVLKLFLPPVMTFLRVWDRLAADRVDLFVANSRTTAARIRKYYRRDSVVVNPPVEVDRFISAERKGGDYYLAAGRLVPYKRIDLAIEAARIMGRRLVVIGEGNDRRRLERLAKGTDTEFLGFVSNDELASHYAGARALLFPGEEDFGITPIEAMAAGTPVIAYGRGGVAETLAGGLGILFDEETAESLASAIGRFETEGAPLPERLRAEAVKYAPERFREAFTRAVEGALNGV